MVTSLAADLPWLFARQFLHVWESAARLASKKQLARITEHTDFVYDVAFSPDGKQLATLGRDSIKMWSTHKITGRQKRSDPQLFFDESRR